MHWRAPLLAAAFVASVLGSGAAGALAVINWTGNETAPPAAAAPAASTGSTSLTAQSTPANVASTVYDRVSPSVVQITVAGAAGRGNGSGFVVDASGHILTNAHVVDGARSISVRFSNGQTRTAQLIGSDRGNDLAVIKVDLPRGVPAATLGDSSQVAVGELAIAIGSPFGLENTVTQGIVSAVDRTWQPGSGPVRRGLIQTDAPINPGNSGGPLLNARGEVIGVNAMIESPVQGSVGIGFAIGVNVAKQLLPQLQAGARLEPVWLGISGVAVDPDVVAQQRLSVTQGVLVSSTVAGAPAALAGVRTGDVIASIDGAAVSDVPGIAARLAGRRPGDVVRVAVVRGSQRLEVNVTLQPWPTGT